MRLLHFVNKLYEVYAHTHATRTRKVQRCVLGVLIKSNLSLLRCFRLRVDDACQNSSSRPSSVFFRHAHHARRRVPLQGFSGRTETKRTEQAPWRKKIHGRSRSSWAGRENLVPPRFAAVPCCCSRTYRPAVEENAPWWSCVQHKFAWGLFLGPSKPFCTSSTSRSNDSCRSVT